MADHQHQRISCENQSRASVSREGGGGAECGLSLGFHFQTPFSSCARTCVNSLPDVIKTDGARGKQNRHLIYKMIFTAFSFFFITSKIPAYFYTSTQTTHWYRADSLFNTLLPQSHQNVSTLQGIV